MFKGGNYIKIFNFVNFKKDKVILSLNSVQIDLLIKSLYVTQCVFKKREININLLFENIECDFDLIFYLQRIIACTANKQLYNIIDNDYFIKDREKYYINNEKTIDKNKVI